MRHEWADRTDDGGGALVGIYILEREDGLDPRLRYQYTDGTTFLSEPARADWMPEMLRRERLLDTVCRIAFTARDGGAGGAEAVVVLQSELLAALDRICPPQAGAKPRLEDCPCGDYGRPGHPIGEWCGQGKG